MIALDELVGEVSSGRPLQPHSNLPPPHPQPPRMHQHLPLQLAALALQRRLLARQLRHLLLQAVRDVLLLRLELVLKRHLVAVQLGASTEPGWGGGSVRVLGPACGWYHCVLLACRSLPWILGAGGRLQSPPPPPAAAAAGRTFSSFFCSVLVIISSSCSTCVRGQAPAGKGIREHAAWSRRLGMAPWAACWVAAPMTNSCVEQKAHTNTPRHTHLICECLLLPFELLQALHELVRAAAWRAGVA